jgi:hypothetical protein
MAAIAINYLYKKARCDNIGITYLFCNYNAQADQSVPSLFTALLKQLVQDRPDIAAPVIDIYHLKQKNRPSLNDIFGALQSVCSNYTAIHIVVNALNEYANKDSARN